MGQGPRFMVPHTYQATASAVFKRASGIGRRAQEGLAGAGLHRFYLAGVSLLLIAWSVERRDRERL